MFTTEAISMSFSPARRRLGCLEISFASYTLMSFLEKSWIRRVMIIGQISMKSWFRVISLSRRMRILIANRIRIRREG